MPQDNRSAIRKFFKPNKEQDRYYLLPGMGGRALRRKQRMMMKWAVLAGLLTAGALGGLMYYLNLR